VFLGDVGSYAFGASLATLALVGLRRGIPLEAVLAPLSLYVADTGSTLVRRFRRGEAWYRPHREHVYQQLVVLGWSHVATTSMIGLITLTLGALGAVSLGGTAGLRVVADLAIVALLGAYLGSPAVLQRVRAAPALA
jgi:UDP-N-acetylmuramyl pentapeptide phosphotransferase/UDP-N-acetylglucosamine-1-phosphate transferase